MSFIYVFLLILFAHESFSASFDRLPCAFQVCGFSPEKAQVIYRSVGDIHQRLTDEQYDLYLGITEELDKESPNSSAPGAAGGGVRKLAKLNASSGKSESGRSSKKENDSIKSSKGLLDANYALASLCIVTNRDEIVIEPLYNMPSQSMYDSCFEGMHNLVPGEGSDLENGLDTSIDQWKKYLGSNALILNEKTYAVKSNVIAQQKKLKKLVQDLCQQCNQLLFEEIKSTVSLIEKERQTYFSFLRNWGTAWHNEQRIIYDIDSPRTIERLQTIHHKQGIKLIIACVHTRLAPCIASESYKSCDCYHCLQNWPEIWLGSQFPSLMTVSYVTYPESSGEQIYSDKQTRQNANSIYKYFIGQYVSSVLKPSGRGKRWLNEELSFYTSHINYFKTNQFSNFFDQALMDAFKPILDVCRVSYIDKALCIQSNQFSVQKRLNTEKTMTLILDDYIEVSMAKLYLDHDEDSENITMEISANDNDWVLLLKSYVLEHRRFKRSSLAPTVSVGVGNPVPDLFQQEPSSINDSKDSLTGSANLGSVILDPNRDLSVPLVKDYTTTDSNRYVFFRNAFIINSLFLVINQFVNSWQK